MTDFHELGKWVVVDTSTTQSVATNMHIQYLICISVLMANIKKANTQELCMGYSDETWNVGSSGY